MDSASPGQERLCWRAWPCAACSGGVTPLGHILECLGSSSAIQTNSFEPIVREQIAWLNEWLDKCPHAATTSLNVPRLDEGSEHLVCWDVSPASVLKQTRLGIYGEFYYLDERGMVCQENSWPVEYLIRLRLWEKVFGSAPQPLGLTANAQIISRQKFITGVPPTQEQVDDFLLQAKLVPVKQNRWLWKIPAEHGKMEIWIGDARSDNFVLTPEGIVPIDIRIWNAPK